MLEKGRKVAALRLEVAESDIEYRSGAFAAVGTDHSISLFDIAAVSAQLQHQGQIEQSLDTNLVTETPPTFPNGCHIAEAEIDPETGQVIIVRYTAVQDSGRLLNEMIVTGQFHGGLAQGLGQILCEQVSYDLLNGQLQSGSFMDYGMPRADDMPVDLRTAFVEVPSTTNPLGVKGIGEGGTTGALGAVMNAIVDAIPGGGGASLTMPVTASKVWQILQGGRSNTSISKRQQTE
jgi:carbon-monoxide dehydrogenase large subunit